MMRYRVISVPVAFIALVSYCAQIAHGHVSCANRRKTPISSRLPSASQLGTSSQQQLQSTAPTIFLRRHPAVPILALLVSLHPSLP